MRAPSRSSRALAGLAVCASCACSQRPSQEEPSSSATSNAAVPSTVTGPFVNDPVMSEPPLRRLPEARGQSLSYGEALPPAPASDTNQPTPPSEDPPTQPSPTEDPPPNTALGTPTADVDLQLRGLQGVWYNEPSSAVVSGQYSRSSQCVLTIRSRTRAREECSATIQYEPQAADRCGELGRTRVRITGSNYTLTTESGEIRFTPGPPELVRDDEGRCTPMPAGRHTFMLTEGWTGEGDEIRVLNTSEAGSVLSRTSYTRRR
jgi:hypothetical protein